MLSRIIITFAEPPLYLFFMPLWVVQSTKWFWQWTRQLQCLWDAQLQGCSFGLLVATIQPKPHTLYSKHEEFSRGNYQLWSTSRFKTLHRIHCTALTEHSKMSTKEMGSSYLLVNSELQSTQHQCTDLHTRHRMPVVALHTFSPHISGFMQRLALDVTKFTALTYEYALETLLKRRKEKEKVSKTLFLWFNFKVISWLTVTLHSNLKRTSVSSKCKSRLQ